jgi:hypothetical protein
MIYNIMGCIGSGKSTIANALVKYLNDKGETTILQSYAFYLKNIISNSLPGINGTQADKATLVTITEAMADDITDRAFKLAYEMSQVIFESEEEGEYFVDKIGEDFAWIPMRGETWTPRDLLIEIADTFKGVHSDCFLLYQQHQESTLLRKFKHIVYEDARFFREIARVEVFNVFVYGRHLLKDFPLPVSSECPSEYLANSLQNIINGNDDCDIIWDTRIELNVENAPTNEDTEDVFTYVWGISNPHNGLYNEDNHAVTTRIAEMPYESSNGLDYNLITVPLSVAVL